MRFLLPIPAGITVQAWQLLSIFLATIVALVLEPLPVGACAFLAATTAVLTGTLTFAQTFSAFNNDVIWLIVVSFFFAKGFEKTGLGDRVANLFVRAFGKSTLGLAYGLSLAETLVCPAMPSTSARAGGIFNPIIKSLAVAGGSEPGPTASRLGRFLTMSQLQSSSFSSALYMTGAAQNLLCLKLASELGVNIGNPWMTWILGACVPCVLLILATPLIIYKLCPPEVQDTPDAPRQAAETLQKMGPMSDEQKIMLGTMLGAVALWMFGDAIGVSSVVAAMLGLACLLCTGVLTWRDCLSHGSAWDTLTWFAILVGMSGQLNTLGVIKVFSDSVGGFLATLPLGWPALFGILNAAYFLLHYLFASQTAHVGALYAAFLALMMSAGVPPVLAALALGYNSNLFGAISHYASGQAAIYFGSGYLDLPEVFRVGALYSLITATTWGIFGFGWWKILGWA